MRADGLVSRILDDEGLTAGLNDPEARLLVEWLVERTEHICEAADSQETAAQQVEQLCKRARSIRRFVTLWCHNEDHGAASQLVATERLDWPLPPTGNFDPCDVMLPILSWEQTNGFRQSAIGTRH